MKTAVLSSKQSPNTFSSFLYKSTVITLKLLPKYNFTMKSHYVQYPTVFFGNGRYEHPSHEHKM